MSNLNLTRDWLQNVLRPFPSRERIQQEVLHILSERRTLAVKTEAFTFDSGHTALLLLIHGTLPITFRGATYHIPIHLWIPHEYPRAPPMAFVMPTKEMGVRKSREVEPSGRVSEVVVDGWWRSWESKSLDQILKQLASVFSAAPPVYAKPPAGVSSPQAQSPLRGAPSPAPVAGTSQNQPPPPPARPVVGPPQPESLPVYRAAPTPPPHPWPQQSHSRQGSVNSNYAPQIPATLPQASASPPVPARPIQRGPHPQSPNGMPSIPQRPLSGVMLNGNGGIHPQGTGYRPGWGPQAMTASPHGQSPVPLQSHTNVNPTSSSLPAQSSQQAVKPSSRAQTLPATRQPTQDLLSSPEPSNAPLPSEPTGPPPPPPTKPPPPSLLHLHSILLPHLNAALPSLVHSLQSSVEHLKARTEDLTTGEPAIRDEMARLEAVKKVCDSVGRKMEDVVQKGEDRVAELESKGEIGVDELVCGISIVHNQLIDLVAEDNAIEDTIYHLTRALDSERIDLDRYLKSIRSLAREQYMKRALIERILQGMGQTW
ncbi:hypothetical protein I350_00475 [Cryptococcus amylolentus CBS 6273]|uniref:UEV domain-containing protein n=1 Tax=Cryptococcus amylolentus CBS 6273 TaxID=1296118 RepID=A0A1E3KF18_9TREE|nr:hypothetical protein I350_00475 [Cryptococcus amylolentus CBS 6273]